MRNQALVLICSLVLLTSGCGYTRQASLPSGIQTLHVNTVVNKIPLEEVFAYQPGLEISITNALIKRFQQDGNLKIVATEEADAILEADLVRFEQEGVRFSSLERVEEYRLFIVLNIRLVDRKTGNIIFEETDFSGDAEYFVSNVRSLARQEASERAISRLARNIVDRVVEDW